jgi:alpha-mannosidase
MANAAPIAEAWKRGVEQTRSFLEDETVTTYHVHACTVAPGRVVFAAPHIPALGYRTFWVRAKEISAATPSKLNPLASALLPIATRISKTGAGKALIDRLTSEPAPKPPYIIENEFFTVEAVADGTITLTDKRDGTIRTGLNRFVDMGDRGDEYNFCPPESDSPQLDTKLWGVTINREVASQTLELAIELTVPAELAADRKSRSEEITSINIVSRLTLSPGIPRVDIHTEVENDARDHRLRVHFPTGLVDSEDAPLAADFDGHFEIVRRPIGLPEFDETWVEQPRPEVPQRAFTDVSDGTRGLMVANRGLPEVAVLKRTTGATEIAVTLLRCVGWLSRDDLYTRPGHAGPGLETPGAQLLGDWEFDYSIIPHIEGQTQPYQFAYAFETPLRAAATGLHGGSFSSSASFVDVEPGSFVISAVKETEDGKGWLVRGYNIGAVETSVTMKPWHRFRLVELVNLAEEKMEVLEVAQDNSISFTARTHEIVTVKFTD